MDMHRTLNRTLATITMLLGITVLAMIIAFALKVDNALDRLGSIPDFPAIEEPAWPEQTCDWVGHEVVCEGED